MKISIIIPTCNRENSALACLKSILYNNFENYEIIVIDQGDKDILSQEISKLRSDKIKYFKRKKKNKSLAINFALNKAKGEIIAFTDDDCLVAKNWLKKINHIFSLNAEIVGIFGQFLPYREQVNKEYFCPSVFKFENKKIFSQPINHQVIGFGGNCAFRSDLFKKLGGFNEFLGPGAWGEAAEDAEFTIRVLSQNLKIMRCPEIKIYHNCWLNEEQKRQRLLRYNCGEIACYFYYSLRGFGFARQIVKINLLDFKYKLFSAIKTLRYSRVGFISRIKMTYDEFILRLKGFVLGIYLYYQYVSNLK